MRTFTTDANAYAYTIRIVDRLRMVYCASERARRRVQSIASQSRVINQMDSSVVVVFIIIVVAIAALCSLVALGVRRLAGHEMTRVRINLGDTKWRP